MAMAEECKRVMMVDNYYIDNLEEAKVYGLEDINKKEWDFSLATIKAEDKFEMIIKKDEEFKNKFYEKYYDLFKSVDFSNIIIAGGAVSNILINNTDTHDIDIFFYGITKEKADEKVIDIIKNMNPAKVIINNNFIELDCGYSKPSVQIIFKIYEDIKEILYTFDLGSSEVGFDGEKVYFSEMGKFAYETMCNITIQRHITKSYEYRLMKYLQRGFNVILPKLKRDENKIIKMNTLIPMKLNKNDEGKVFYEVAKHDIIKFLLHKNGEKNNYEETDWSDAFNRYDIQYINVKKIIENSMELYEMIENCVDVKIYDKINIIKRDKSIDLIRKNIGLTIDNVNKIKNEMSLEGRNKNVKNLIGKDLSFKMKYLYGKELTDLISAELKEESGKYEEKYLELVNKRSRYINDEVMKYVTRRIEKMNETKVFFNWRESDGKFELFRPGKNADKFYEYEIIN